MKPWVVIAAYNEAPALPDVLSGVLKETPNVVLVDDGSSDSTPNAARQFPVHYLRHRVNLGQGASLQTGIRYALVKGADTIVTFDGDGQMDPTEIPLIVDALHRQHADVALGNRFIAREASAMPFLRKFMLKAAVLFTRITTGLAVSDTHNGFRAFRRSAAEKIDVHQNGMAHASEILHQIAAHKMTYTEFPVKITYSAYARKKGQSNFNAFNILWELFFR